MKYFNKIMVMAIMLFTSGYSMASIKKLHLDHIKILNLYGGNVACEFQWKDRNGAHTEQLQDQDVPKGEHSYKGPLLGYGIERIIVTPSSMVAAGIAIGGVGMAMMVPFQGHIHGHGNKYFVVTPGEIPKGAVKGKLDHKAEITGYKDEKAYNDAMAAKKAQGTAADAIKKAAADAKAMVPPVDTPPVVPAA